MNYQLCTKHYCGGDKVYCLYEHASTNYNTTRHDSRFRLSSGNPRNIIILVRAYLRVAPIYRTVPPSGNRVSGPSPSASCLLYAPSWLFQQPVRIAFKLFYHFHRLSSLLIRFGGQLNSLRYLHKSLFIYLKGICKNIQAKIRCINSII